MMIELEDVRGRIAEYEDDLVEAHISGVGIWATMLSEHPKITKPLNATSRANIINNHIWDHVGRLMADRSGVDVVDCCGVKGLLIGSDVFLRFKFVGHGAPSNVATTQQKGLSRQEFSEEMTLALTGDVSLAPPTLLTCGYTLDDGKLGRLEIRRDCKGHQPWMYDIYGGTRIVRPEVFKGMEDEAKPATIRKAVERREEDDAGSAADA